MQIRGFLIRKMKLESKRNKKAGDLFKINMYYIIYII